ncbi:MAG: hypothetical protein ACI9KK_002419 [Ascidiaceihabitans sp.]
MTQNPQTPDLTITLFFCCKILVSTGRENSRFGASVSAVQAFLKAFVAHRQRSATHTCIPCLIEDLVEPMSWYFAGVRHLQRGEPRLAGRFRACVVDPLVPQPDPEQQTNVGNAINTVAFKSHQITVQYLTLIQRNSISSFRWTNQIHFIY